MNQPDVLIGIEHGPPAYILLQPEQIAIDHQYQRPPRKTHVRAMVKGWDWALCGVLVVSKRQNGTIWCVDGQHRLAALAELGHGSTSVPCIMLKLTAEQEARVFGEIQTNRRGLTVRDRYRAGLRANDPVWTLIRDTLASNGRTVLSGASSSSFSGLSAMHRIAKVDPDRFVQTISWAHKVAGENALANDTIKGVDGILISCRRFNVDPINGLQRLVEWGQSRIADETRKMANRNGTTITREVNSTFRLFANKYPSTGRSVKRDSGAYIPSGLER